ncbi:class I SAM-dependent DNA methyltransferase [Desulfospira joergensenii]|uniref:class I SAM-dependent DNA methyltransferase n=1 Tax=Desulfospira joergensenii TaxID=53329 RepID=UPI0013783E20|nr:tetratricopeptide repeat protein [Desulfospira joergensenii]
MNQWYSMASELLSSGNYIEAISIYRKILSILPDDIVALNNQGLAFLEVKQYDEAMEGFKHAVAINPNIAQLHYNMGRCLHKQDQAGRAIVFYQKAIGLDENLGAVLKRVGRVKEAADCYRQLMALDPNDANARYMLDGLSGMDRQKKAPREFVTGVFDDYADHFEDQLVRTLDCHVPSKLKQAFVSFLEKTKRFEALLDLGCGTGLAGEAFQDLAGSMTGVDLSGKMLEKAREKGVYYRLFRADIREFLSQGGARV